MAAVTCKCWGRQEWCEAMSACEYFCERQTERESAVICRCGVVLVAGQADFLLLQSIREIRGGGCSHEITPWESHGLAAMHSNAMPFCVFLWVFVAPRVKRGLRVHSWPPPEFWPEHEPSLWLFLSFFVPIFCPSPRPPPLINRSQRETTHLLRVPSSFSLSISPGQMFKKLFVYPSEVT